LHLISSEDPLLKDGALHTPHVHSKLSRFIIDQSAEHALPLRAFQQAKADVSDFGKKVYGSVDESLTYVTSSDKMYYGDLAPFASEFMGTFLLCFTVGLCAGVSAFAPLAIGASLMVRP
jgi:hypothetical protein